MIDNFIQMSKESDAFNTYRLVEKVNETIDVVNHLDNCVGLMRALMPETNIKSSPKSPEDEKPSAELIIKYLHSRAIFNVKFEQIDFTNVQQVLINGITFRRDR